MRVTLVLCLVAVCSANSRSRRDLFGSASDLFSDLQSRISTLQSRAAADFESNVRPWIDSNVAPVVNNAGNELGRVVSDAGSELGRVGSDLEARIRGVSDNVGSYVDRNVFKPFRATQFNTMLGLGPIVAPWWQKEHVCEHRTVVDENEDDDANEEERLNVRHHVEMTVTTCKEGQHFHECTTKVNTNGAQKSLIVRHTCCKGFRRVEANGDCTAVDINSLDATLEELGGNDFLAMLRETELMDLLSASNLTVFMPSDRALEAFADELEAMNDVEGDANDFYAVARQKRQVVIELEKEDNLNSPLRTVLSNHFVMDKTIKSADMKDDMLLNSVEGQVRLSVYNTMPRRTVLANCAKLVSLDHLANNEGVVHVVDQLVMPAKFTLAQLIQSNPDFSLFSDFITRIGLMDRLNDASEHLTIFVPTNKAFEELDEDILKRLNKVEGCASDILKHHVLPNVVCSSVIENEATTMSVDDKLIKLKRENVLSVDGVEVIRSDMIATNGVLHVVKSVLKPKSARSLRTTLMERGSDSFVALMEQAGLLEDEHFFDNKTIFVPSEKSLQQLPEELIEEFNEDNEKLKDFLLYHVASPEVCQCEFRDNLKLKTALDEKQLRMNVYSSNSLLNMFTAQEATLQCVAVTNVDDEACGSTVHGLEKVLFPPSGDLMQVLKLDSSVSEFVKLIEMAELEEELNNDGPFTVFAPNNDAFNILSKEQYDKMFSDASEAAKVVRHHIAKHQVCCAGIPMSSVSLLNPVSHGHRMMDESVVETRRSHTGHLFVDTAEIVACDSVAHNGVVHTVDRVIRDRSEQELFLDNKKKGFNIWKIFQ